jgi:hypothetical protein
MQPAVLPSCASAHIRLVWGSAVGKSRLPQRRSRAASQVSELITSWTSRTYSNLFITDKFGPAAHWIIATTQFCIVSMHRRGKADFSWLWTCLCVCCGMVSSQRNVVQSTGALREQQELSQQPSAAAGTQIVLRLQVATSISEVQASAYLAQICIPHRPALTIKVLKTCPTGQTISLGCMRNWEWRDESFPVVVFPQCP